MGTSNGSIIDSESAGGDRPDRTGAIGFARHSGIAGSPFRPQFEQLEDRLAPALTAVGAGPGGEPLVTILDQTGAAVHSFLAYAPAFTGGVEVAMADVTGDGVPDNITGAGPGGG